MTLSALLSAPRPATAPAEPLLREVLGALLRRARVQRAMTLRELAAASTVSLAYLSEVERGHKEPSSEVLAAICQALGLRILDLVAQAASALAAHEQEVARARAVASRPVPVSLPATVPAGSARADVVAIAA